ncbi:MAG TPA: hypothetical protein DCE41_16450 [Cytophagales bacterium]|nr:hypothetical protein [Cytophagales bacterium]HAA24323.1 hypothetical protein [Cytophagales bacterium]HAP63980.1 hypothetical protein [Cytophagales bacterium]
MINSLRSKENSLFIVLSGIFLTNALLAELIGVKIFSLEKTLGLPPARIPMFGDWVLNFDLTAGVLLWPVVFITTDIINEYFGKKGVRRISFLTVGFIAYSFLIIVVVTAVTPADFWLDINAEDPEGNAFNMEYAFRKIFRQGGWIIVGSIIAFLIGQLLDAFVFQKIRKVTKGKRLWLRATGSTLISQFVDSFVVLWIAFYIGANWTVQQWFSVALVNYMYKFVIAVALTPTLYIAHNIIDKYLGKDLAKEMTDAASEDTSLL